MRASRRRSARVDDGEPADASPCPELPAEVWIMVMQQCGNHPKGFITQLRLQSVQKTDGAMLPHIGAATELSVYQCH